MIFMLMNTNTDNQFSAMTCSTTLSINEYSLLSAFSIVAVASFGGKLIKDLGVGQCLDVPTMGMGRGSQVCGCIP